MIYKCPTTNICDEYMRNCKNGDKDSCRKYNENCARPPTVLNYYKNAYWQCYDGTEEKAGDECKSSEEWQKLAEQDCRNQCNSETGKCGVNSFSVFNECGGGNLNVCDELARDCKLGNKDACIKYENNCVKPPQDFCEELLRSCKLGDQDSCKKYDYNCQDADYGVRLNEKFKLKVGSEVKVIDYRDMKIELLGVHRSGCSEREVYATSSQAITGRAVEKAPTTLYPQLVSEMSVIQEELRPVVESDELTICKGGQLIAKLKVSINDEKHNFISINLGEKKEVFGTTLAFLDYYSSPGVGIFIVSSERTDCPKGCICTADGSMDCPTGECKEGYKLCPDGICRRQCGYIEPEECKFGCLYNEDSCLPIGTRADGQYCSINRNLEKQRESNEICENDFECRTNSCLDGQCTEPGFWQRIAKLLGRFFS